LCRIRPVVELTEQRLHAGVDLVAHAAHLAALLHRLRLR
jgi:hypothetical protein